MVFVRGSVQRGSVFAFFTILATAEIGGQYSESVQRVTRVLLVYGSDTLDSRRLESLLSFLGDTAYV